MVTDPTGNAGSVDTIRKQIAHELRVDATFDPQSQIERRVTFLADALRGAGKSALVLAISGGVDSTVAGRFCRLATQRVRADGHHAVFIAMRLPYGIQHDEQDAQAALSFVDPDETLTVNVKPPSDASLSALSAGGFTIPEPRLQDFIHGNTKARQRMVVQYAVAAARSGLVVGTDHAAEAVTGFFTKHGDGAADVIPLQGLTKRRVRALASALGAPESLVRKTPTADLETLAPGKPDEEALGLSYDDIDDFLEGEPVPPGTAQAIIERFRSTAHKRQPPSAPPW